MSSGKFCCKSWRKLLVPGTCPTALLEVNYCFSCTAQTTCASIPAAPARSPAPSSAPASSSHQAAPRHRLHFTSAPLSSSRHGGGRPHTCSPGSRAHGCRSFPLPLVAFSSLWAWHNVRGILLPYKGKIMHFTQYASKPALFIWFGVGFFFSFSLELTWYEGGRTGWGPGRSGFCSQIDTVLPEGCNQTFSLLSALASLSITRELSSF